MTFPIVPTSSAQPLNEADFKISDADQQSKILRLAVRYSFGRFIPRNENTTVNDDESALSERIEAFANERFQVCDNFYKGWAKFVNGVVLRDGKGKLLDKSGNTYEGIYKENELIEGRIRVKKSDGEIFEGEVKLISGDLLRHGFGQLTYPDGEIQRGIWQNDEFIKGVVKYTKEGNVYVGTAKIVNDALIYCGPCIRIESSGQCTLGKMENFVFITNS